MDELTGEFVNETREMLEQIGDALLRWEGDPQKTDDVGEIFRFVHTVKGSCGFLELPRIASLADAAETVLGTVRDKQRSADGRLVGALLAVVDRIGTLVSSLATQAGVPDEATDAALIAALGPGVAAVAVPTEQPARPVQFTANTVRVSVPLLEEIMTQLSDALLIRNVMARAIREIDDPQLTRALDRLTSVVGMLRDSVTRTRMQPVARVLQTLPRLVRDTAALLGKQVTLEIIGQDVEIDREMGEAIRDPLLHIVRNAIDHGIESPAERRAAGKPATGTLRVVATQTGNQIRLEISDDGRGIATERLIAKAVACGRFDAAKAAQLEPAAAAALVFEPGLTTADTVSAISGRGVGMDVVRANVERLGGIVQLSNSPGRGLSVTLRAPLTLSIVTALIIRVGGCRLAIPRSSLEEIVRLGGKARLEDVGGAKIAIVRGLFIPAISLADALGLAPGEARLLLVIATPDGRRCAVAVDEVFDHEELVVRAMAPQVAAYGFFSGQSLNEDGDPVILLDPAALTALGGTTAATNESTTTVAQHRRIVSETILLARAFDGRRIAVRSVLVDRLVEIAPAQNIQVEDLLFVPVEGELQRAVTLSSIVSSPDAKAVAILLKDGVRKIALLAESVEGLVEMKASVPVGRGYIEALVEEFGEPAFLLSGSALLAADVTAALEEPLPVRALAQEAA